MKQDLNTQINLIDSINLAPEANTEEMDSDPRYKSLIAELQASNIGSSEACYLHQWLSIEAEDQEFQEIIDPLIIYDGFTKKIDICKRLEECALEIKQRFDFLQQPTKLDGTMAKAFRAIKEGAPTTTPKTEKWSTFRNRIADEAELLAQTFKKTADLIEATEHKGQGRRSDDRKNSLIFKVFSHVSKIRRSTQEECAQLTSGIFNIYFPAKPPANSETQPEAVLKAMARMRRKIAKT